MPLRAGAASPAAVDGETMAAKEWDGGAAAPAAQAAPAAPAAADDAAPAAAGPAADARGFPVGALASIRAQLAAELDRWERGGGGADASGEDGPVAVPVVLCERQRWLPLLGWGPWLLPGVDGGGGPDGVSVALDFARAHPIAPAPSAAAASRAAPPDEESRCGWRKGSLHDVAAWKWALDDASSAVVSVSAADAALPPPWEYATLLFGAAPRMLDPVADPARSPHGAAVRIRRWVRWALLQPNAQL